MTIRRSRLERFSVTSSKSFRDVVLAIEATVGRPNMNKFGENIAAARTPGELEKVVHGAIGPSGLMEFIRFDIGEILRKELGEKAPRILRLVVGNPLIMKQMVRHVPDGASYAPVTILIDERPDGVHLSYDRMAGYLASYGSPDALRVARDLDSKVEALLTEASRNHDLPHREQAPARVLQPERNKGNGKDNG